MSEKSEALRLAENLENPWWGMTASPSGLPEVSLVAVAALRADAARLLREQHARLLREQHAAPSEDIDALRRDAERYRWMKQKVKRIPPAWDLVGWDDAIDAAMQEDKP